MKEEVFEASLTPEMLKRIRKPVVTGKGTASYGPLDRTVASQKERLKEKIFENERMWSLLRGSYDVHQHSGPSSTTQRLMDELDCAIHGCYAGQGGIAFKNHDSPSTRSVKIVQRVVDQWAEEHGKKKIELFGGVVLNYSVGGLNPEAVISAYRLGGKFIWMPNLDANHHRKVVAASEGQGIDLIDENDKVVPKLKEILALIAETDMVLSLCHQSTKERLIVVREAVKMGVKRIEINHVNYGMSWLTPDQCKIFADLGAYLGVYAMEIGVDYTWDELLAQYKAAGPERIVFASDCGHIENPYPLDGMRRLILGFLYRGVPDTHVKMMCQTNAYNLLH